MAALLLILALSVTCSYAEFTPSGVVVLTGYKINDGETLFYLKTDNSHDAHQKKCVQLCEGIAACKGYVTSLTGSECWGKRARSIHSITKDANVETVLMKSVMIKKKSEDVSPNGKRLLLVEGIETDPGQAGKTLFHLPTINQETCLKKCESMPNCHAVAFNTCSNDGCWGKDYRTIDRAITDSCRDTVFLTDEEALEAPEAPDAPQTPEAPVYDDYNEGISPQRRAFTGRKPKNYIDIFQ